MDHRAIMMREYKEAELAYRAACNASRSDYDVGVGMDVSAADRSLAEKKMVHRLVEAATECERRKLAALTAFCKVHGN